MTFETIDDFIEWLLDVDDVTVQETHVHGDDYKWVAIEDVGNSDPLQLAEAFISAHDSGFRFASFFADRYGGMVTIAE